MREQESFSRRVSQEVAGFVQMRVNQLTSEECHQALIDLDNVKRTRQWNFMEYALKPILCELIKKRWMNFN